MLAVVFNPKACGWMNSFVFHYPVVRPGAAQPKLNKADAVPTELAMLEIKKGLNFVDPEVWKQVQAHPRNRITTERLMGKNAFQIFEPSVEAPIGATSDFADLSVVATLVEATVERDLAWLKRCLSQDQRPRVFKLLGDRIQELEEDRAARKQQSLVME